MKIIELTNTLFVIDKHMLQVNKEEVTCTCYTYMNSLKCPHVTYLVSYLHSSGRISQDLFLKYNGLILKKLIPFEEIDRFKSSAKKILDMKLGDLYEFKDKSN